jgi:rhomboid protease GlpG
MIELARLPIDQDLGPFSKWLNQSGVQHRVVESDGEQLLILVDASLADQVHQALQSYLQNPELKERLEEVNASRKVALRARAAPYDRVSPAQAPLVFGVIAICLAVAWLTGLGEGGPYLRALLIVNPFEGSFNMSSVEGRWAALLATIGEGEFWRLITPDFLHFSLLHITFNLLMFWVLGGQVERRKGWLSLLTLIIVVSLVSNVAQLLDGDYFFGGLSGVVYGLFGFCWVWSRYDSSVFMPDALFRFALVWLIIGYTPLTEWVGLGRMANSAHLYGLLSGLVWAWLLLGMRSKVDDEAR